VFCPYHSDEEWQRIQEVPEDWARAVEVDKALRKPGTVVNRNMNQLMYMHDSCLPLDQVDFAARIADKQARLQEKARIAGLQGTLSFNRFNTECEGVCGV
jgi:hypothetical protein